MDCLGVLLLWSPDASGPDGTVLVARKALLKSSGTRPALLDYPSQHRQRSICRNRGRHAVAIRLSVDAPGRSCVWTVSPRIIIDVVSTPHTGSTRTSEPSSGKRSVLL